LTPTSRKLGKREPVLSVALVVTTGNSPDGERDVLGRDRFLRDEAAFEPPFLRGLSAYGLKEVQFVITDARTGVPAIRTVLQDDLPSVGSSAASTAATSRPSVRRWAIKWPP